MTDVVETEQIKLRAAFYNNLATGFVITGYAVPYFAFLRARVDSPPKELTDALLVWLTDVDLWAVVGLGLWAGVAAWFLRRLANRILEDLDG